MRWLLAVGTCAAVALAGCGGNSDSDTASSPSDTTQATTANVPGPSHQGAAEQARGKEVDGSAAKAKGSPGAEGSEKRRPGTIKVPPISPAAVAGSKPPAPGVKTVKGGDNSVQEYGVEAGETARTEAAIALQAYLNARAQEDWGKACSGLAQRARDQLDKLVKKLESQGKDVGCAGVMAVLDQGTSRSQLHEEATITEVLSLRGEGDVPGDPSYLIFTGPPGSTLYSMPMYLEGGGWKVGLELPSELPV